MNINERRFRQFLSTGVMPERSALDDAFNNIAIAEDEQKHCEKCGRWISSNSVCTGCQAKAIANEQARSLGYADVADLYAQSKTVSQDRINEILQGAKAFCRVHEAVAVLHTNPTIKDVADRSLRFNPHIIGHYFCGWNRKREHHGKPDIKRLMLLPEAILAVKSPLRNYCLNHGRKVIEIHDSDYPTASQRIYELRHDARRKLKTFVYVDSGYINGWFIADR